MLLRMADGRKPVRDHEAGPSREQFLAARAGWSVSVCGSTALVASSRMRRRGWATMARVKHDQLPLARAEVSAALAHLRLVAFREAAGSSRACRGSARPPDTSSSVAFGRPNFRFSITVPVKRKFSCVTMPICSCSESIVAVRRFDSVDRDSSVAAVRRSARCRLMMLVLPEPVCADQRDRFARLRLEADVLQYPAIRRRGVVAKEDVLEDDVAAHRRQQSWRRDGSAPAARVSSSAKIRSAPAAEESTGVVKLAHRLDRAEEHARDKCTNAASSPTVISSCIASVPP